jgi:hypothetical protein
MVDALEKILLDQGHMWVRLVSTETARSFYHAAGYHDVGPPEFWGRLAGYPMEK